jgi:hypothetical protein
VADEAVVGQDAAQVVVAIEHDAKQVERLALEPVGRVPDSVTEATTGKIVVGAEHLDAHALVQTDRQRCDTTHSAGLRSRHLRRSE